MTTPGRKSKFTEAQIRVTTEAAQILGVRSVSRATGIHRATISRWTQKEKAGELDNYIEEKCPDAACESGNTDETLKELRLQKKLEFVEQGWDLALKILQSLEKKHDGANFKDLATGFGILFDKLTLASGDATSRTESLRAGTVSREDLLSAAHQALEESKLKAVPPRKNTGHR